MWRKTPQTILIKSLLAEKGHATNQELAALARRTFPNMTNTTVHRITARLVEAKMASYADIDNRARIIDANTVDHDHFVCRACQRIFDIEITDAAINVIQQQLPGRLERHNFVVTGLCTKCKN